MLEQSNQGDMSQERRLQCVEIAQKWTKALNIREFVQRKRLKQLRHPSSTSLVNLINQLENAFVSLDQPSMSEKMNSD